MKFKNTYIIVIIKKQSIKYFLKSFYFNFVVIISGLLISLSFSAPITHGLYDCISMAISYWNQLRLESPRPPWILPPPPPLPLLRLKGSKLSSFKKKIIFGENEEWITKTCVGDSFSREYFFSFFLK